MIKKLIAVLIAVMCCSAFADEWYDESTGYTWGYSVSNNEVEIRGVSPNDGNGLNIPETINGMPVTTIGRAAFSDCSGFVGELRIPNTVKLISTYAFAGCTGLTGQLNLPASLERIGESAFYRCSGFTGSLIIPRSVTKIDGDIYTSSNASKTRGAFESCSGFDGRLVIQGTQYIGNYAFSRCENLKSVEIAEGTETIGSCAFLYVGQKFDKDYVLILPKSIKICEGVPICSKMVFRSCPESIKPDRDSYVTNGKTALIDRSVGAEWFAKYGPSSWWSFAGFSDEPLDSVDILSSEIRQDDPTILDVKYRVNSNRPVVKVRAIAFEDGEKSWAKVVRVETLVDGTNANIGDAITANEEHTISWKVSSDWSTKLAKVKVRVLATEDDLVQLELMTLPACAQYPAVQFSWNDVSDNQIFDALLWLYADKDEGLTLKDGVLKSGDTRLASGDDIERTSYDAHVYVYKKMGYELLEGEMYDYVKARSRLNLPPKQNQQFAYKIIE